MRFFSNASVMAVGLWTVVACSQAGQTRQASVADDLIATGNAAGSGSAGASGSGNAVGATPGGLPAGSQVTSPGSTGPAVGMSPNGSASSSNGTGQTLEQCQGLGKAWEAVVSSGAKPADCIDQLVPWCCTRQEISARFPTIANAIEQKFQQYIDQNGEVLYACAITPQNAYSFSMAKIVNGTITYDVVTVSGVAPVNTGSTASSCPVVKTANLSKASLMLFDSLDERVGESIDRDLWSEGH